MISRAAEYGLRTVVCLASRSGRPMASRRLAAATGVPVPYQAKILQILRREGLVEAYRGVGGGFVLACSPGALSMQQVIDAVDPPRFERASARTGDSLTLLRQLLCEGEGFVQSLFGAISIAELCRGSSAVADSNPAE